MAAGARPLVVVTRRLPPAIEARMADLFEVELNETDEPFSRDRLADALARADVLVPTITDDLDGALLAGARTRLIANFGNGVDHIDLRAARAAGIVVTNAAGVLTEDTADMGMALILAVPRRLSEGEAMIRDRRWQGWAPCHLLGHRIGGKALGIVGMGRIGQAIARRARAFGLSIHYHNRRRLPEVIERELAATWHARLDAMLGAVDIVSVNCPHTPETNRLLDRRRLGLLRPDAYLINIARGEIVDEAALVEALEERRIAGAGLDVFEREPAIDPRLIARADVVLLPHLGSATIEGRTATGEKVIANIRSWLDGHRPPDQVLDGWA